MKKLLLALFAVIVFSCNRDSGCYECTTSFKIVVNDGGKEESYTVSAKRTMCNTTEAEIREYENFNTDSTRFYNGPMTIDTIKVTKCIL